MSAKSNAKAVGSFVLDHPSVVTIALCALVMTQAFVAHFWLPEIAAPVFFDRADDVSRPTSVADLAIGVAGVAAMVGGFAGVVVVFGLSSDDARFRKVRLRAATSLRRNWTSVVTTPLVAAFGAIIASGLATATELTAAIWILEVCVLLAAHGAVRLVVVLRELVKVVNASDEAANKEENTVDSDEFLDD